MNLSERAQVYAALGDRCRLAMVDALQFSDRTFIELADLVELPGNAAAHHLAVLEAAGLIERRVSDGDHRRRYISLRHGRLAGLAAVPLLRPSVILFICTHNSARSQFAAALWRARTGGAAESAGTDPATRVHPLAVQAAGAFGLHLAGAVPRGYDAVSVQPDLVVSVCDRAREAGLPFAAPSLHWSVPDPVAAGTADAFNLAFADLSQRLDRLAAAVPGASAASIPQEA